MAEQRCVGYFRQSKDNKVSMADQRAVWRRRVETDGYVNIGELEDGVSASSLSRKARVDWPKLLQMIKHGGVDIVWLWEASRGDRKASAWLAFLGLCADRNVLIYIEDDRRMYDPALRRDWETLAEHGIDSEGESRKVQERTMRMKNEARLRGDLRGVLGGRPRYGWRNGEKGWEVDPATTAVLRKVAKRVLAGEALMAVHADLGPLVDAEGVEVTYRRLRKTLLMPVTAGLMLDTDGTIMETVHTVDEPPLDRVTWNRLGAYFKSREKGRPAVTLPDGAPSYPLSKLLRCGKCGNQLSGDTVRRPNRTYRYYFCANAHPRLGVTKACRGVNLPADELHELIEKVLGELADTPMGRQVSSGQVDLGPEHAELAERRVRLQEQMAAVGRKRRARHLSDIAADEAEAELEQQFDKLAADEDALVKTAERAQIKQLTLKGLSAEHQRRLVSDLFVTPIMVRPAQPVGASRVVDDRVDLTLR